MPGNAQPVSLRHDAVRDCANAERHQLFIFSVDDISVNDCGKSSWSTDMAEIATDRKDQSFSARVGTNVARR